MKYFVQCNKGKAQEQPQYITPVDEQLIYSEHLGFCNMHRSHSIEVECYHDQIAFCITSRIIGLEIGGAIV